MMALKETTGAGTLVCGSSMGSDYQQATRRPYCELDQLASEYSRRRPLRHFFRVILPPPTRRPGDTASFPIGAGV